MRESTQKPLPTEIADPYSEVNYGTDGTVASVLNSQGFLRMTAFAVDVLANVARGNIEASSKNTEKAQEIATAKYRNVKAVEFRFDDGEVVNFPMMIVSGMRYKVGLRTNAMISKKYGNFAIGTNGFFANIPDLGDKDYLPKCRIDDPVARKAELDKVRYLIDEAQIVDPEERRPQPMVVKVEEVAALAPILAKENPLPEDLPPWPPEQAPTK